MNTYKTSAWLSIKGLTPFNIRVYGKPIQHVSEIVYLATVYSSNEISVPVQNKIRFSWIDNQ